MSEDKKEEDFRIVEEYIKTGDLDKIEEFSKYLAENNIIFNGWVKQDDGSRLTFKLVVDGDINPVEPEIKIITDKSSLEKDFSKIGERQTLYMHTDSKKYVCEVRIVYVGEKHIFILPPNDLFIKEQRRVPRIKLKPGEKYVQFKKDKKEYRFSLLDISKTGMAFVIPSSKAKVFSYVNDSIYIFKIFGNELPSTILGSIVYIKKIEDTSTYRVGVHFYDEIDITAYEPKSPSDMS